MNPKICSARQAGAICLLVAATLLSACGGGGGSTVATTTPTPTAAQRCAALVGAAVDGGNGVVTAAAIAAAQPASGPNTQALPEYCTVTMAAVNDQLVVAANLPTTVWNKKMLGQGGGGFDGSTPGTIRASTSSASVSASQVAGGYAIVQNNGGHPSSQNTDAAFALDGQSLTEYTYLAMHRAADFGKSIIQQFYGQAPDKSYFEGCSTGGHDAMMESQRFPEDYDGIIARAPAGNFVPLYLAFNRISTALRQPGGTLNAAKQTLLANAVLAQCDALDGAADGVISKPSACHFDPTPLRCQGGVDTGDTCLSDAQLHTVHVITDPYSTPDGKWTHPGFNWGGENLASGWGQYIWPNATTGKSTQMTFSDQWVHGFMVGGNNSYDPTQFDAANFLPQLSFLGSMWDAYDPDLSRLHSRGGKMIMWDGTTDTSVTPRDVTNYADRVVQKLGQTVADQTFEAFQVPGVGHCGGGPGADVVDLVAALDKWVSAGTPPSSQGLVAKKINSDGSTALSRPLCKYPSYPRYKGVGDLNDAANYACSTQ